jgi:hypothetical protein
MSRRSFRIKGNNDEVKPCPECGNNTDFVCRSEQVADDGCEVWAECKCGHNPSAPMDRMESVMGGCGDNNCYDSLSIWNDSITS